MMSKKDYEKIAKIVKKHHPSFKWDIYVDFVDDLCVIFHEDSAKFDPDRFRQATGIL